MKLTSELTPEEQLEEAAWRAENPFPLIRHDESGGGGWALEVFPTEAERSAFKPRHRRETLQPVTWPEYDQFKQEIWDAREKRRKQDELYGRNSGDQLNKNVMLANEFSRQTSERLQIALNCDNYRDKPKAANELRKLLDRSRELDSDIQKVREIIDPF